MSQSDHKPSALADTTPQALLGLALTEVLRQVVREELQALQQAQSDVQPGSEQLLDVKGLATALGVKPTWIYEETRKKADPKKTDLKDQPIPHFRVGRYPRFELSRVKAWIEARQKTS